ncbi:MAG: hypothetical protein M3Y77_07330 [Actinomycetota bacterium]|nr:hypothetical protein [Actinomycetota bacterium]
MAGRLLIGTAVRHRRHRRTGRAHGRRVRRRSAGGGGNVELIERHPDRIGYLKSCAALS